MNEWAGVTFTAQDPNCGSTDSSATTVMVKSPSTPVMVYCFPIMSWYRSSSGWTATAVSPSLVSGRAVARTNGPYLIQ